LPGAGSYALGAADIRSDVRDRRRARLFLAGFRVADDGQRVFLRRERAHYFDGGDGGRGVRPIGRCNDDIFFGGLFHAIFAAPVRGRLRPPSTARRPALSGPPAPIMIGPCAGPRQKVGEHSTASRAAMRPLVRAYVEDEAPLARLRRRRSCRWIARFALGAHYGIATLAYSALMMRRLERRT